MKQVLAAVLILAATSATAFAGDDEPRSAGASAKSDKAIADDDCKRARKQKKVCALSFDTPEEVIGKVISPTGEGWGATGAISFSNLIRMRWDFRAEIIRAAEDV